MSTNVDVTRIAGNIQALNSLNAMQEINSKLALHQIHLATGKKMVSASEDPAGMSIAVGFDIRRQGMQTALKTIGDGKSLLSVMEGGLKKVQDILVKMRNKALEAQSDTIGLNEKQAIQDQLHAFRDEINDIVSQTEWNGNPLLGVMESGSASNSTSINILTTPDGGVDAFDFSTVANTGSGGAITAAQGFYSVANSSVSGSAALTSKSLGLTDHNLNVTGASSTATLAMNSISRALDVVKQAIGQVGAFTARLTFKEEAMSVAHANTEAAYNRIMNANMAEEQVEASKLSILQQTSTAMLAQANVSPQFLLTLFQ